MKCIAYWIPIIYIYNILSQNQIKTVQAELRGKVGFKVNSVAINIVKKLEKELI